MTKGENGGRKSEALPPPPPPLLRESTTTTTSSGTTTGGGSLTPPLPPPPHATKVNLIQNRLIDKLNRSHSDLTHDSGIKSRTSRTAISASRLIHSVRRSASSTQLLYHHHHHQSSSVERLFSSPELQSPNVVKRAMGNVIRSKSATSSSPSAHKIQVKLEVSGTPSSTRKSKEILTLKSRLGDESPSSSSAKEKKAKEKKNSKSKLPKTVKISNTVSVQNGESSTVPLNVNASGNGQESTSGPVKPPRKSKSNGFSSSSNKQTKDGDKIMRKSSNNNAIIRSTPTSRSESPKPIQKSNVNSRSVSRSPTPTGVSGGKPPSTTKTTPKSLVKSLSVPKSFSDGLSKIINTGRNVNSGGKNGSSNSKSSGGSKVKKPLVTLPSTPIKTTCQQQSQNATSNPTIPNGNVATDVSPKVTKIQQKSLPSSSPSTIVTITQKPLAPPAEINPIKMTLPILQRYRVQSLYSSTPSLYSYKSLPTLAPYLAETKRVSNSIFLTRTRARSPSPNPMGFPRPTKTSLMREIIAREPVHFKDATIKHISDSMGALTTLKNSDGSSGALMATSVLDLGFKPRQRRRRSVSCLNLKDYTQYILQLRHSYRNRSPRFSQLHRLYSSLDRLCQLERSTSSLYDVSPVLSMSKRNDFDAWWKVRNRLRIEQEMAIISRQLLHAQHEREFFFRPKLLEQFRWTPAFDSHLRFKKWSVDELKSFLMTGELPRGDRSTEQSQLDLYKTQWRGMSVKELALNLEVNDLVKKQPQGTSKGRQNELFYENRIPMLRRAFSMSSTLSEEQRDGIKRRIGSLILASKNNSDDGLPGFGRLSRSSQRVQTTRMGFTLSSDRHDPSATAVSSSSVVVNGGLSESVKKEMSRSISEELKERRVKETNKLRDSFKTSSSGSGTGATSLPLSTRIALRKAESVREKRTSPSTFYSIYCKDGVNNRIAVFEQRGTGTGTTTGVTKQMSPTPTANKIKPPIKVQIVTPTPAPVTTKAKVTKTSEYKKPATHTSSDGPWSLPPAFSSHLPLRRSPSPSMLRNRSPIRRSVSPEQLGKEYVSHVNIISKLASLLLKRNTSLKNLVSREVLERDKLERLRSLNSGEVERLRDYFESYEDYYGIKSPEINLLRCLFCSDSNLAKITEKLDIDHKRRCASAMDLEENEKQQQHRHIEKNGQNRSAPDGSSPTPIGGRSVDGSSSPALYLNTRSRKPIYQPSSTPNICQPTLTAHCHLQPSESLERVESPVDYDVNYDSLPYSFSSPAPSSLSSYYGHALPPRRILDERLMMNSTYRGNNVNTNTWSTTPTSPIKGYSYTNYDPAAHQPRYRYVPQPPLIPVVSVSTTPTKADYYRCGSSLGLPHVRTQYDDMRGLRRSESFHSTALPSRQNRRMMSPPPRGGWNNQNQVIGGQKWHRNGPPAAAVAEGPKMGMGFPIKNETHFARISCTNNTALPPARRLNNKSIVPQETAV